MKNINLQRVIYLSTFSLLLLTIFAFVSTNDSSPTATTAVSVDVQFGRGPNCTSRGVCSVDEPGDSFGGSGGDISNAQIHINASGQTVITILKVDISPSTIAAQFVNGYFEQQEDVTFPNYFAGSSESNEDLEIKTGSYQVVDLGDRYSISF